MDSNTHSASSAGGLGALVAELDRLAAQNPDRLPDGVRAERVLVLRRLVDRLEGHWLKELAAVDACGAAGADQGTRAASTASWLRNRLHVGAGAANSAVRTARALFRGPLPATAAALTAGQISAAHAAVVAHGIHDLPDQVTTEAEPVLLEAAQRLDPLRLRRVLGHLRLVADPGNEQDRAEQRHGRRGVWLSPTWEGMVAVEGLLEAEAGQTVLAALEPLARPQNAEDTRSGGQRTADALAELARRALEGGRLPQTGGVRPQLSVVVDLDSLLAGRGALGGDAGWVQPLDPQACRRLACDGAVTRVLVTRHPTSLTNPTVPGGPSGPADPTGTGRPATPTPGDDKRSATRDAGDTEPLAAQLRAAMTRLPPVLGGAPTQPLEVGRTTRVVQPAQRIALVVRDGGCVFPDCDRPPAWSEAHHLVHWLDGGPTDLANLALLCRAHHRAVHEGGWRLGRDPDGRFAATPPPPAHRRHPDPRHSHRRQLHPRPHATA